MLPGNIEVLDGTLAGELYASINAAFGEVDDEDGDEFRRNLCSAFGEAIATHANETIVEPDPPATIRVTTVPIAFAFFNATANTLFPSWQQTAAQTSADVVSARLPCPYPGRVKKLLLRADSAPGSVVWRMFRATGTGTASALTGSVSMPSVVAGTMREAEALADWTFAQGDWISPELNPSGTWGNADGVLVVEYDVPI